MSFALIFTRHPLRMLAADRPETYARGVVTGWRVKAQLP